MQSHQSPSHEGIELREILSGLLAVILSLGIPQLSPSKELIWRLWVFITKLFGLEHGYFSSPSISQEWTRPS